MRLLRRRNETHGPTEAQLEATFDNSWIGEGDLESLGILERTATAPDPGGLLARGASDPLLTESERQRLLADPGLLAGGASGFDEPGDLVPTMSGFPGLVPTLSILAGIDPIPLPSVFAPPEPAPVVPQPLPIGATTSKKQRKPPAKVKKEKKKKPPAPPEPPPLRSYCDE